VRADGLLGEHQLDSDPPVGQTLGDERHHLALAAWSTATPGALPRDEDRRSRLRRVLARREVSLRMSRTVLNLGGGPG
jgi:hypothetical protein